MFEHEIAWDCPMCGDENNTLIEQGDKEVKVSCEHCSSNVVLHIELQPVINWLDCE